MAATGDSEAHGSEGQTKGQGVVQQREALHWLLVPPGDRTGPPEAQSGPCTHDQNSLVPTMPLCRRKLFESP